MYVRGAAARASAGTTTYGAEAREETAPEEGQRKETARTPASNPSTSGFTGKPALVLDRPGGIPQGYDLTSRRSVTEPRWVSSPPSYCATAPLLRSYRGVVRWFQGWRDQARSGAVRRRSGVAQCGRSASNYRCCWWGALRMLLAAPGEARSCKAKLTQKGGT